MIRARVREVRNRGLEPTAVVEVKEVLKSSLVNIPRETQTLFYSSSCLCPPLTVGEEYLIMGYENEELSRYRQRRAETRMMMMMSLSMQFTSWISFIN